jgi:hypothetical protein
MACVAAPQGRLSDGLRTDEYDECEEAQCASAG